MDVWVGYKDITPNTDPFILMLLIGPGWKYLRNGSMHNWEPSVVTCNYENIRSLRVVILSQDFPLSYLVQPLERLKYIKDLVQMHLSFEGIGPKI